MLFIGHVVNATAKYIKVHASDPIQRVVLVRVSAVEGKVGYGRKFNNNNPSGCHVVVLFIHLFVIAGSNNWHSFSCSKKLIHSICYFVLITLGVFYF